MRKCLKSALVVMFIVVASPAWGQDNDRSSRRERLIQRFDTDGDGRLDREERRRARAFVKQLRQRHRENEAIPQTVVPGTTDLYKLKTGPYTVESRQSFELRDPRRDKIIPLRITWPNARGPHPLIVFCHGALGSKDAGQPLVQHWASHGYVVIQPTFGDSMSLMS